MKEYLSESFKHSLMTNGYGDPFSVLGMHKSDKGGLFVRVCYPGADKIEVILMMKRKYWVKWKKFTLMGFSN